MATLGAIAETLKAVKDEGRGLVQPRVIVDQTIKQLKFQVMGNLAIKGLQLTNGATK